MKSPNSEVHLRTTPRPLEPGRWLATTRPSVRSLLVVVAVGVGYAIGAQMAWSWFGADGLGATFFPAAGVSLAALLLSRRSRWIVVLGAVAVAEFGVSFANGLTVVASGGYAAANSVQALVGALLITSVKSSRVDLGRTRDLALFIMCGVLAGPAVGAAAGASVFTFVEGGNDWLGFAIEWWTGDGLGALVVGAAILASAGSGILTPSARRTETFVLVALCGVVAVLVFWFERFTVVFVLVLLLLFLGYRVGAFGCAVGGAVVAFLAAEATSRGHAIWDAFQVAPSTGLPYLQLALGVAVGGSLAIASATSEREHAFEARLQAERARRTSEEAEQLLREVARRDRYRAAVADVLREVDDPEQIKETSTAMLGRHLKAARVHYADVDDGAAYGLVLSDYVDAVPSVVGRYLLDEYGPPIMNELRSGHTVHVDNVREDPRVNPEERRRTEALGIAAYAMVPLMRAGRPIALLAVHSQEPREWTVDELTLMEEAAERTRSAIERAQALSALGEREARYRSLFTSIDEGFSLCEVVVDGQGRPVDYRFLETNPRFEEQTGLVDAIGKTARELVPGLEDDWVQTYARVGLGGESLRFENYSEQMDRWFDVFAAPVDPIGNGRFVLVFNDISDRKRVEETRRRDEESQRRALKRAELLAAVMADLDRADTVEVLGQRLVEALVPRLGDFASVTVPHVSETTTEASGRSERWSAGVLPPGSSSRDDPFLTQAGDALTVPIDVAGIDGSLLVRRLDSGHGGYSEDDAVLLRDIVRRVELSFARAKVRDEEHAIALRLQGALLPAQLPAHPAISVAARYTTGSDVLQVGGDWYEVLTRTDGLIGFAVGDVVGSGVEAAAAMGRLRVALAALSIHWDDPGDVLRHLDDFASGSNGVDFATVVYAVLDPATGDLRYAAAGHPPSLVVSRDGQVRWLLNGRSPPIGRSAPRSPRATGHIKLDPGDVLFLYSDGLIERRGEPIDDGLDRLERAVGVVAALPVGDVCERIIHDLTAGHDHDDDVVAMSMRFSPVTAARFHRLLAARPEELAGTRVAMRSWLTDRGASEALQWRVLLAVGEALANAVEHAYQGSSSGTVDLTLEYDGEGGVDVEVRDSGRWRGQVSTNPNRGRGIDIIEALAGRLDRKTTDDGTTLRFRVAAADESTTEPRSALPSRT